VDRRDPGDQLGVVEGPAAGDVLALDVVGGTGDLEQRTGPLDAVLPSFLRLDERPDPTLTP
jgi:hypothetical protein